MKKTIAEVYIDLYFLINVSMDLITLMITATLLHRPVRRLRFLFAAAFGGCYAVLSLLLSPPAPWGFLGDLTAGGLICLVAFGNKELQIKRRLKDTALFAIASMILGGVMTAFYTLLNRLELPFDSLQGDGLSVWVFALLTAVAGVTTLKGGRLMGLPHKTKAVTLEVTLLGTTLTLNAMVDSGNLLRDPISGKGVIVVKLSALAPTLPAPLRAAYQTGNFSACFSDPALARLLHPIPTRTATGDGMLFALKPSSLTVVRKNERLPADHLIAPAPLGNSAQSFDAIFPLE